MKKLSKQSKRLIRIVVCLSTYIVLYALDKTIGLNQWWALGLYLALYIAVGVDVVWKAMRNITQGRIFDENFLMVIATIGAFGLGDYPESCAVMLFYQVGELFQDFAVGKSRKSIAALMDIRPDKAIVLRDGEEVTLMPEEVTIGDIIIVRAGERVPLDGIVVSGSSYLDTSALTGESAPRAITEGDVILSGSININGVLRIRAEKEYYDSTVSKILDMAENASGKKAKAENFITKFARYYTPFVVVAAVFLAVLPPIVDGNWIGWLTRALTFLVISCPCALVISVPLSFFGGIGSASKRGILFKGASYLEMIDKANIFVFDKTGTLTKGVFEIKAVVPESNRAEILSAAAIAENGSTHPIARSILSEVKGDIPSGYDISEHSGLGIRAVLGEDSILCGNASLMESEGIEYSDCNEVGSVVHVARNGKYLGYVVVADTARDDTKEVISKLKEAGATTIMLTGDNEIYAKHIAAEVGIDTFKSGLLPGDKVMELDSIITNKKDKKKDVVAFVGDGINDAPVLVRADIGISMGGVGSDSAVEASDMVLMHDTLSSIIEAKKISKRTLKIVYQNIVFVLLIKAVVLILGAFGYASMWLAVFADVGVSVLAIINSMRALKQSKK